MKVILVDDEPLSLNLFKLECGNMPGFDVVVFLTIPPMHWPMPAKIRWILHCWISICRR